MITVTDLEFEILKKHHENGSIIPLGTQFSDIYFLISFLSYSVRASYLFYFIFDLNNYR